MSDAAANVIQPDYGLDAPQVVKNMFSRGAWILAFGLVLFFMNHSEYPAPADHLLLALGAIAAAFIGVAAVMIWSSKVAKPQLRDRLLDSVELKGDEKVLDVGCGRGLLMIGAAKRLKTGKVTGVDVWSQEALSKNSSDSAKANAKLEGVADRVRIENGDARKLVYPDNNFDVVISSLAIHNIPEYEERTQAIREMWRVLRPGGRMMIFDIFYTSEYAEVLRKAGASDVTLSGLGFLWCVPSRSLVAKK